MMRMDVASARNSYRQLVARAPARSQSLLRLDEAPGSGGARVEIEGRTGHQHVDLQAQHAHGLSFLGPVDGREIHLCRIDDGHTTGTLDLDELIRADEGCGILIESHPHREWVVGERGQQPPEAIALTEVLVDDETVGETQ